MPRVLAAAESGGRTAAECRGCWGGQRGGKNSCQRNDGSEQRWLRIEHVYAIVGRFLARD